MKNRDNHKINDANELKIAADWWFNNFNTLLHGDASHLVQRGELLSDIAERYYGDPTRINAIVSDRRNTSILSTPSLMVGQSLFIPPTPRRFFINLMNEWGDHKTTAKTYANAYNAAMKRVRDVYPPDQPIIIDVPAGRETAVAASAVKGINDPNFILSVHIYPGVIFQYQDETKIGSRKDRP
jgi:hypothetical protein